MTNFSIFFTVLFYIVLTIFFVGLFLKIKQYAQIPAPLKIPIAPAPLTRFGVILRIIREVTIFESLFKSNKWTWLFGFLFHFGLLLVVIHHIRLFWPGETPSLLLLAQPFKYAAFAMIIGLIGLLVRRIVVDRVRYISAPSDYLMLILLLLIGISGFIMTFTDNHTNVFAVKKFASGILSFNFSNLPNEAYLIVHLLGVFILLAIFPISKLLHAPGIFFSPTLNQIDNSRKKRHISKWALTQESNNEIKLSNTLGRDK